MAEKKQQQRKQNQDLTNYEVTIGGEKKDKPLMPEFMPLRAELTAVDKRETQKGDRVRFVFDLTGKYDGRRAWGSIPLYKNPSQETDLYRWIEMLLGRPLRAGEKISLGQFKGHLYDIILENSTAKNKDGNPYQNVIKVTPVTGDESENVEIADEESLGDETAEETTEGTEISEDIQGTDSDISEDDLPF